MESVSPSPAPTPRTGRTPAGRPRGGLTAAVQPRADQTHAGQSRAALTAAAQPAGGGARRQLLRLVTVSAVLAGLLGVSACQLDSRPDPAETATDLAQAREKAEDADEVLRKKSKEAKKNPQWKSSACLFWPLGCEGVGASSV